MSQHTPKRWAVHRHEETHRFLIKAGPLGGRVTLASLEWLDRALSEAECEANARLIAKAPELLELLKIAVGELRDFWVESYQDPEHSETIREAAELFQEIER